MQRKLLALAVAGAFAVPGAAIAQVTISGQFRYSADNVRWNDATGAAQVGSGVSKWGLNSHSSNIKFTSRESLGGGMTAWGVMEAGLADGRLNAQNALWNGRNSGIGIDSNWGTVMIGLWDTPYKSLDGVWSIGVPAAYSFSATAPIFGNGDTTGGHPNVNCSVNESGAGYTITSVSNGTAVTAVTTSTTGSTLTAIATATVCGNTAGSSTAFQRRTNNALQYWSPVWNGVQLLIGTAGNEEKANLNAGATQSKNDPKLWSFGLRWAGARWGVIGGYERHTNYNLNLAGTNRGGKDTGAKIGGNYNFGPVQVSLAWERLRFELGTTTTPTDHRQRNTSIGLAIPIGNGAIRSQASRSRDSGTAAIAAAGTVDANARLFNLSYEYNMSKRTLLYLAYAKLSQGAASNRQFGTNLPGQNGFQAANGAGSDPRFVSFGMNHTF